jgi:hypothetical protein
MQLCAGCSQERRLKGLRYNALLLRAFELSVSSVLIHPNIRYLHDEQIDVVHVLAHQA